MVKPDWNIFEAKFPDKEAAFEWFVTLLFCRECGKRIVLQGYFNQAAIEKSPIQWGDDFIGFQAKYYKDGLSKHKSEIVNSIKNTKKFYPEVNKYYFYSNSNWSQKNGREPQNKREIENLAKTLGIEVDWRTTESFFKMEFVCKINADISEFFFTQDNSFLSNLKYFYEHTKHLFINVDYKIQKNGKLIQIDRSEELQKLTAMSQDAVIIHGEGGCGKSALIKKFMEANSDYIFLGIKAIELNNFTDIKQALHNCIPEQVSCFFESYNNKFFIIDSAEKLLDISDNTVFFQLIEFLKDNKWKIIFSTRDNYFESLYCELVYTLDLSPCLINITAIDESKLRTLLTKNNIKMPMGNRLIQLICNTFYLKYYVQFYSDDLQSINYQNFKAKLWNSFDVPIEFIKISQQRAKTGCFYIDVGNISSLQLSNLMDKKLITKDGEKYFISHDIFEEWALEKYLDVLFSGISSFDEFLTEMGTSFPIRRSYRQWLSDKFENNVEITISQALDYIKNNLVNLDNVQDTIIAILLSNNADIFFKNFDTELLENNCSLLKYIQRTLRLACKSFDEEALAFFNIDHSLSSLENYLICPKGSGWHYFIDYIYNKKNIVGIDKIAFAIPLFREWSNKNRNGNTTKQVALLTLEFYKYQEEYKKNYHSLELKKDIFLILSNSASEIKKELTDLFDEILSNKWKNNGDKYSSFVWELLRDKKYLTLWTVLPQKVLQLAYLYWIKQVCSDKYIYISSTPSKEELYGVEDNFKTVTFPASALQTPIYFLLCVDYENTINFIIAFLNKVTYHYINKSNKDVSTISFYINEKEIKQFSTVSFWNMFRGIDGGIPELLQCILMALEKYFIDGVSRDSFQIIEKKLLYILEHSKTVALSAVVCSVFTLHYKNLYSIGKIFFPLESFLNLTANV